MSDYKDNALVVQSNQFVRETSNNLKANEIKMFDIFVSCIDTMNPKNTISISKSELLDAMGDAGTNYTITRDTLKSMFSKSWLQTDDKKTTVRHFIDKYEWYHEDDLIKIEFHKDIMPMLINLKKNFLQYSVSDLNTLNSRYSLLMYKYILSYIRQYKTTDFVLSLDQLRQFLNLKNKYQIWGEFNRNVLKKIENEINNSKSLPYLLRCEPLKNGRKVNSIRFLIRPRTSNKETNFMKIDNKLIYEERYNDLIKGKTSIEEIRQRQADYIINNKQG